MRLISVFWGITNCRIGSGKHSQHCFTTDGIMSTILLINFTDSAIC